MPCPAVASGEPRSHWRRYGGRTRRPACAVDALCRRRPTNFVVTIDGQGRLDAARREPSMAVRLDHLNAPSRFAHSDIRTTVPAAPRLPLDGSAVAVATAGWRTDGPVRDDVVPRPEPGWTGGALRAGRSCAAPATAWWVASLAPECSTVCRSSS